MNLIPSCKAEVNQVVVWMQSEEDLKPTTQAYVNIRRGGGKGLTILCAKMRLGMILILSMIISTSVYPQKGTDAATGWRSKAVVLYKQALNEYNRGNYVAALNKTQKSLSYCSYKKNRKLLVKLREVGYEKYRAGTSLINFQPELALKYLKIADDLIDPKDKKTKEKIKEAIEQLRSTAEQPQDTGG